MKTKPNHEGGRAERNRKAVTGRPESPASRETFAQREKKPGHVGLANEARPGLGSRGDEDARRNDPAAERERVDRPLVKQGGKPKATPYGYSEPTPEPREQSPNSLAHEEERSTGASGHMGNG